MQFTTELNNFRVVSNKAKPLFDEAFTLPPASSTLITILDQVKVEPISEKIDKIRKVTKEHGLPDNSVICVTNLDDLACFVVIRVD